MDFSEDGTVFATSGKDLAVRIYDTKTFQVKLRSEMYCYSSQITSAFVLRL